MNLFYSLLIILCYFCQIFTSLCLVANCVFCVLVLIGTLIKTSSFGCSCHLALAAGGVTVVVEGGATLTDASVISYFLV